MKMIVLLLMMLVLCGCDAEETFETVADEAVQSVMASPREISVRLPDNAVSPVLDSDTRQVYFCEEYEIIMETLASGDLNASLRGMSGYDKDKLTVMETQWDDVTRYEFVWASAGERGERIGRGIILDDGNYHYCMSVLRDADTVSQVVWRDVFASFTLI